MKLPKRIKKLVGILSLVIVSVLFYSSPVHAADEDNNFFSSSDFDVDWVLTDATETGGILKLTFHEPIRLVGSPNFTFQVHFMYMEMLYIYEPELRLEDNPGKSEWTIIADMSKCIDSNEPLKGEWVDYFLCSIPEKVIESVSEPHVYNDKIVLTLDVSDVQEIEDTECENRTQQETFTLQGVKTTDNDLAPGIYIVRSGKSHAKKIVVK